VAQTVDVPSVDQVIKASYCGCVIHVFLQGQDVSGLLQSMKSHCGGSRNRAIRAR
jgi:hypothetical protein